MARIAKSLGVLRDQINAMAPGRKKTSDGWIGNTAHQASKSDHNPDSGGVVRALDITHDPAHGVDAGKLADQLRKSKDLRIYCLISNRRIAGNQAYVDRNGGTAWVWGKYTGKNPHDLHFHTSVVKTSIADNLRPWVFDISEPVGEPTFIRPTIRRGSTRVDDVKVLQRALKIEVDGKFGAVTEAAVKKFQASKGLVVDGIVGPYSWQAFGL